MTDTQAVAQEKPFPQTREELFTFFVEAFGQMMTTPANVSELARSILAQSAHAVGNLQELQRRNSHRAVVTRTEFPGCLRAVLHESSAETVSNGGEPMYVEFTTRQGDAQEWLPVELNVAQFLNFSKLVLSESRIIPGEVFYVTTQNQVESIQNAVIDAQLGFAQTIDTAAEPEIKH